MNNTQRRVSVVSSHLIPRKATKDIVFEVILSCDEIELKKNKNKGKKTMRHQSRIVEELAGPAVVVLLFTAGLTMVTQKVVYSYCYEKTDKSDFREKLFIRRQKDNIISRSVDFCFILPFAHLLIHLSLFILVV